MSKIQINAEVLERTAQRCRERNIIIPTFAQQMDPTKIPQKIVDKLQDVGLWDVNSLNLFRITWKNDVKSGGFGKVNYIEFPSELTGVPCRILALVGKYFPTGAHKVGATFGCLAPRLVTGQFDPTTQKAVWPSTGNFCRGGAYNASLLACESVAILPEEMSKERFEWLHEIGSEVIATPGCESNVKEIYDKCWELRKTRGDKVVIYNQFDEFGNGLWHYHVTAGAMMEVLADVLEGKERFAGYISATGSAGTLAAGNALKKAFPTSKIIATEALQCPTLLLNGYGGHRIEGIGDKHVPWIHDVKNTDMIAAIDDDHTMRLMRLFNEPAGHEYLTKTLGLKAEFVDQLPLVGISGMCNLIAAIKAAKYWEATEKDVFFTVCTDSMELYASRVKEQQEEHGDYTPTQAAVDWHVAIQNNDVDHIAELSYQDRKRIHNLKYFTWIEQQARELDELNAQWYDDEYFDREFERVDEYDRLIEAFNEKTGLLAAL